MAGKKKYFQERGLICKRCGWTKFKTITKNEIWQCRACRKIITNN